MIPNVVFTKSVFKRALECPASIYYLRNKDKYPDKSASDPFLESLAEGGFQVGALAKIYFDVQEDCDLSKVKDKDDAVRFTKELLLRDQVVIAEAGFYANGRFVRVDILKKDGDKIEIIEVKAKSTDGELKYKGDLNEYYFDVAFQRYVVIEALSEAGVAAEVSAWLMLADKRQVADVDGLNQAFKIVRDGEQARIVFEGNAAEIRDGKHILTPFNVDSFCDQAFAEGDLENCIEKWTAAYLNNERINAPLMHNCKNCSFPDGFKECWEEKAGYTAAEFEKTPVWCLWRATSRFFDEGLRFLSEINRSHLRFNAPKTPHPGLTADERKIVQVALMENKPELLEELAANVHGGIYLDKPGLKEEMDSWKFPLHMIDFETTAVALPFYKGMRPYEQVAFQFSHHTIYKKDNGAYEIKHAGEYLNTEKGKFPNFEFVRALKDELDKDEGTIFRYSNHENTILCEIARQLSESNEPDKDELIAFIRTITHYKEGKTTITGARDMVDLCNVVLWFYYNPKMKGSNSIKSVLPAILPGEDPYKKLPDVSAYIPVEDQDDCEDDELKINNGGAALTAYSMLQFSDGVMHDALAKALLKYCELDTMAMVYVWQYFKEAVKDA